MKSVSKYKVDIAILICLILFSITSVVTIGSAETLLVENNHLILKQTLWYTAGFILILVIMFIGNNLIYKNGWRLYILFTILLLLVLFLGTPINNSKCWFKIPGIGNFQPSEFMKIILIIVLGNMINNFKEKYNNPTVKDEFIFLLKVLKFYKMYVIIYKHLEIEA